MVPVRLVSALVAAGLLLSACNGEGDPTPSDSPSPSVAPTEPVETGSPTESAAVIDITVVPSVEGMTVEYVEAVINAIEAESGRLFAAVLAEPVNPLGATPAGTTEGLTALFGADRLQLNIEEAETFAKSEEARTLVLPASQYTGVRYSILQVSYAEPGCLIAVAQLNRDGSTPGGGPDSALSIVSLGLTDDASADTNPTVWRVLDSTPNRDADDSANPDSFAFEATLADMDGVVPHDCVNGEASRVD